MKRTIVVIGAGKGLGNAVARKFAENGFKVILMSRNQSHLDAYKKEFEMEGIETAVMPIDVSKTRNIISVLEKAKEQYGIPDVLFYNVGITCADNSLEKEISTELLLERYQIDVAGAYAAIRCIANDEFAQKKGAVLITGGGISFQPNGDYLLLSMNKAALRAMVLALNPIYRKQDIFVGTVQVCGTVGSSEKLRLDKIAEQFWNLYRNREGAEIVY